MQLSCRTAGQVVEEHVEGGAEEILPASLQMREQGPAMFQQPIQHGRELILAAPRKIRAEQIAHGAAVIPVAMTAPLAARGDQPVGGGPLEQAGSIRAFARGREFGGPEGVQAQLPPEFSGQPAGAVWPWRAQAIRRQAQRQRGRRGGRGWRQAIGGKTTVRFQLPGFGVEHRDGLGPDGLLGIVEFAQIEERPLMHGAGGVADIFDHAPVAVFLAVFFPFGGAQKHRGRAG